MESPIQLSLLVVTYNSSSTIRVCLESIFQELESLEGEVIVIDNHSTDETGSILDELATQNPKLKVKINRTNRGFAVGNNQALELARGQHILILNPDTILQKSVLIHLLSELEKDGTNGAIAPQLQFPDGRLQKTCRRFPTHLDVIYNVFGLSTLFPESRRFNGWKMGDFDHKSAQKVDQPAGAALMVRGDLLRSLNGFDENFPMFFNDVDLCKRIKDAGYTIWYLPACIIQHLGGASVKQVKMKMTISSHVSFFRYFEKHFTRMYQQPLNFIVGIILYLSLIPRLLILLLFKGQRTASRETL
ncbi:MAG: glycosyltransferase family 2 protein [Candidatus Marinimicrobia bacterium]|nr:glycosyltransferase family 2 protein [Candidatus Neomarinimicrobiota bacterium]